MNEVVRAQYEERIENAAAAHLLRETQRFGEELLQARAVQRYLLPPEIQDNPAFRVAYVYQPLDHVGGDFIDTLLRDDGTLIIMIGDVSGHGMAAALTSAMLKSAFLRRSSKATSPGSLLTLIDQDLRNTMRLGRFVTAIVAFFNIHTKELSFSSAGHPFPLHIRNGVVHTVELQPEVPLFTGDDVKYPDSVFGQLEKHDRVLLFTDGIVEATHPNGDMISNDELAGSANVCTLDANFASTLYESLLFSDLIFKDDVSLLALEAL